MTAGGMIGTASAPGSSGNLGPGFDVLALAFDLRCRVSAEPAGRWEIRQNGDSYAPGAGDLVRRAVESAGAGPASLSIDNEIPISRGLGSSAAVAVASAAAAMRAKGEEPAPAFLFDLVAGLEGHPDNAAASVYGGVVIASGSRVHRLEVHPDIRLVVGVPDALLSTADARAALDDRVPRDAAARNLARVAFLVEGLRTGDADALAGAGGDELHEAQRRHLSPVTGALIEASTRAGALHAAWSGAGPSVLAFARRADVPSVKAAMSDLLAGSGTVLTPEIASEGLG